MSMFEAGHSVRMGYAVDVEIWQFTTLLSTSIAHFGLNIMECTLWKLRYEIQKSKGRQCNLQEGRVLVEI